MPITNPLTLKQAIDAILSHPGAVAIPGGSSPPSSPTRQDRDLAANIYVDPDRPLNSAPLGPPNASIDANVAEAMKHVNDPLKLWWFLDQVKGGGPWDYKLAPAATPERRIEYGRFGNYNYGRTGIAAGITEDMPRRAAGAAQVKDGHWKPEFGTPFDSNGSFGDDPWDRLWVDQGILDQRKAR